VNLLNLLLPNQAFRVLRTGCVLIAVALVLPRDRKDVIAKFLNGSEPQEIHFEFRRRGGRWLLDDVHSVLAPRQWTLSEILGCPHLSGSNHPESALT
jgi:hypothetical protein